MQFFVIVLLVISIPLSILGAIYGLKALIMLIHKAAEIIVDDLYKK